MKYDVINNECYNLYTIKTDKFKSNHFEIIFKNEFNKKNVTYSSLLMDVLLDSNKTLNTRKLFLRTLENLYNTNIYTTNTRVGRVLLSSINIDFLNPKFMAKESLDEIVKIIGEILFNPNAVYEEFNEEIFNRMKNKLKEEIESVSESPKENSILGALKEIDDTDIRGEVCAGNVDILEEITSSKLYEFYQNFLEESEVSIYAISDIDSNSLNKLFKKHLLFKSISKQNHKLFLDDIKIRKTLNVSKTSNLTQVNFVQIYSLNNLTYKEENYVMPIYNMLWGSGSLESKIYKGMRGENSLCYSINTMYQKYDKVLILYTGIDKSNYEKSLKIIKRATDEMKNGKIDENELINIKRILTNSLQMAYDSPNRLVDNFLFQNIANLEDIEKRILEFNKVSIDDLVNISKKIKLVINYRMGG